jgi:DNA-binding NtrC family response regulator
VAPRIAVVADASPIRDRVAASCAGGGWRVSSAALDHAASDLARPPPDVVVVVAASPPRCPRELACLRALRSAFGEAKFVFVASASSEELAIDAFHSGADRYVKDPWTPDSLHAAVAMLIAPDAKATPSAGDRLAGGTRLVGSTPVMRQLRAHLSRIAPASSTVLILGETGTGKELVAELIHRNGPRAHRPFVCINSAAIPDSLLENELFGHERGAFTGATTTEPGKLGSAQGGTAFLDEIGDIGPALQAKLLRVIENKSIFRLGGTRSVALDVRFVAATNCDLERAMAEGRFRSDLYYRLNVVRVELPALRDRLDDIPLLVAHYLQQLNRELGRSVAGLSPRAMQALQGYRWPGNVRELRNVLEAVLVNIAPETTGLIDVPPDVLRHLTAAVVGPTSERERLLKALTETSWNKTRAASRLHMSRMTLYRRMHHHKVSMRRSS